MTDSDRGHKRKRENIQEVDINGKPGYSLTDAAIYLGVSNPGLQKILKNHPGIIKWELGFGTQKYVLKSDLDNLRVARPSTD